MHFNKPICKTLRTINRESKGDLGISPNLFGFTSVLTRRRVNLTALSKEFIVTYELEQKVFDELVAQYPADFETVCQLRDTILNTDLPESYEGPELIDPKTHFVPINQFVIRKKAQGLPQLRRHKIRTNGKIFRRFELIVVDEINE